VLIIMEENKLLMVAILCLHYVHAISTCVSNALFSYNASFSMKLFFYKSVLSRIHSASDSAYA